MSETIQTHLPLLQAAQAQKHVTVNEALMRIDGMLAGVLVSDTVTLPPVGAVDGLAYAVPPGAVNEWAGQTGKIAIASNGGWVFVPAKFGWSAFVADRGMQAVFDGTTWQAGALSLSASGAGMRVGLTEIDHVISAGATSVTTAVIPSYAMVVGVTARVTVAITGAATSWQLGNPGAAGRFGSGLGLSAGSWARGVLAQPMAFYTPTPLELLPTGGNFAGGTVRLAVHYLDIALPGM